MSSDGELQQAARAWDAKLRLEIGTAAYDLTLVNGAVTNLVPGGNGASYDVKVSGPTDYWIGRHVGIAYLYSNQQLKIEGDRLTQTFPYQAAIVRLVGIVSEALGGKAAVAAVPDADRKMDSAVGRYVYVRIRGTQYRVYFEESGTGSIPIILQHTAGADGREWRHVLEDPDIQKNYRIIAYDMPYHGKSVPPVGVEWWRQEYRLTTDLLMDTIVAVSKAIGLERPVYMGCSIGGYLAADLAYARPDDFRAVIGINAAIAGSAVLARQNGTASPTNRPDPNANPRVSTGAIGTSMYNVTSPKAPEPYRRETGWIYSQGGPAIFAGDLFYFVTDHDLTGGKAQKIDTSKVGVYLLSGEYDPTGQPGAGSGQVLADAIKGAHFQIVKGASHFMMTDDYQVFRTAVLPVLDEIRTKYAKPGIPRSSQ